PGVLQRVHALNGGTDRVRDHVDSPIEYVLDNTSHGTGDHACLFEIFFHPHSALVELFHSIFNRTKRTIHAFGFSLERYENVAEVECHTQIISLRAYAYAFILNQLLEFIERGTVEFRRCQLNAI